MTEQTYWDDIEIGHTISGSEPMTSQRLVMFAAASGDFYQIHYDVNIAKRNNLPDIIVHGVFKDMMVGKLLHGWVGEHGRIVTWENASRGMNTVDDQPLTVWGEVTEKYERDGECLVALNVGVRGKDGVEGSPGTATVVLPRRGA